MSLRTVHQITTECETLVSRDSKDWVRVRIIEKTEDSPTDIEIEGTPAHILEALYIACGVIANLDVLDKEPN